MGQDCERMREALRLMEGRARVALADWLVDGPSGVHGALEAIVEIAEAASHAHEGSRARGTRASVATPPGMPQHAPEGPARA